MTRTRRRERPAVRVERVAVLFDGDGTRAKDELLRAAGLLRWLVSMAPASPDTLAVECAAAALGWAAGRDRNNPLPGILARAAEEWVRLGSPPLPPDPEEGQPAFKGRGRKGIQT